MSVVRLVTPDPSFRWRDAAIGGAAVLALAMIAVGGAFAGRSLHRGFPGVRS